MIRCIALSALFLLCAVESACAFEKHVMQWEGRKRTYLMVAPESKRPLPLVILLHGAKSNAANVLSRVTLPAISLKERFILLAPEAINGQWNNGYYLVDERFRPSESDDMGFIRAIIKRLNDVNLIKSNRIYIAGISNGGFMALRMACEGSQSFTGLAMVNANMPKSLVDNCRSAITPLQFILSTDDKAVPWSGGDTALEIKTAPILSAMDTLEWWRKHNECKEPALSEDLPDVDDKDGSTVTKISYQECAPKGEIEFYRINGGGHALPKLVSPELIDLESSTKKLPDGINHDIDLGEAIWSFFKRQMKQNK